MDFYENVLEECGITPLIERKLGSIEPIMEWTKWLSYIPEFEKNKIDMLRTKKTTDLSLEECKFLIKFEEQTKMLRLFMIYESSKSTFEEQKKVMHYVSDYSIKDLMLSKLTKEEIQYAEEEINKLMKNEEEKLNKKINREQKPEIYSKLSMVDSYILNRILYFSTLKSIAKTNNLIAKSVDESFNNKNLELLIDKRVL